MHYLYYSLDPSPHHYFLEPLYPLLFAYWEGMGLVQNEGKIMYYGTLFSTLYGDLWLLAVV